MGKQSIQMTGNSNVMSIHNIFFLRLPQRSWLVLLCFGNREQIEQNNLFQEKKRAANNWKRHHEAITQNRTKCINNHILESIGNQELSCDLQFFIDLGNQKSSNLDYAFYTFMKLLTINLLLYPMTSSYILQVFKQKNAMMLPEIVPKFEINVANLSIILMKHSRMRVKEVARTSNISWSPDNVHPMYIAAGTSAKQMDASFR